MPGGLNPTFEFEIEYNFGWVQHFEKRYFQELSAPGPSSHCATSAFILIVSKEQNPPLHIS